MKTKKFMIKIIILVIAALISIVAFKYDKVYTDKKAQEIEMAKKSNDKIIEKFNNNKKEIDQKEYNGKIVANDEEVAERIKINEEKNIGKEKNKQPTPEESNRMMFIIMLITVVIIGAGVLMGL